MKKESVPTASVIFSTDRAQKINASQLLTADVDRLIGNFQLCLVDCNG